MKKLFLTLALAFVGILSANAQLWMGGSIGAGITKDVTTFAIAPEVGYSFTGTPMTVAAEVDYTGWAISLRPGVAWMATEHWTAAFRFAFAQYDHGMYHEANGFFLDCATLAPQFGLYYNF